MTIQDQPTVSKEEIKASILNKLKTYDDTALEKIVTHHEVHFENCVEEAEFHKFVIQKTKSILLNRTKRRMVEDTKLNVGQFVPNLLK